MPGVRGCVPPHVPSPAASPFSPERVSNLTSLSAPSQPDASFRVFLALTVNFVTNAPVSPGIGPMDVSPLSWQGEGDSTPSLGCEELPAAWESSPGPSPPPSAGRKPGAEPWPGQSPGAPAGAGCESPPDPSGVIRAGSPASEAAVGEPGLGSLLPEPVSKGCDARRAGGECVAGVRGKFSSFAWRAHVYACEGLDPGQRAALRRWRLVP